jgi:isoquinoline 1-oxidoreductase beta subunit
VHTALAMLVAEELDVPLARVRLIPAGHDRIYGNVAMFVSALPVHPSEVRRESATVRGGQWVVAKDRARARHHRHRRLVERRRRLGRAPARRGDGARAAARRRVARLEAAARRAQGRERRRQPRERRQAHYGELAKAAASTPSGTVQLKPTSEWRLIGTPAPRIDVAARRATAAPVFGMDVRPPGLCSRRSATARCSAAASARSTSRRR